MKPRPHFDDLKRRYREADWVSEFQRLWAIFNHWLLAHVGTKKNDRDCVESLKGEINLAHWLDRVMQSSEYKYPHRTTEGYGGSYPRFAADNEISRFFRAAQRSRVLEPRINWPWRKGTDDRVRTTNAIALNQVQFRAAYDAHASVLSSAEGMVFDITLHQTLPALGVHTTGCCFYRGTIPSTLPEGARECGAMMVDQFRSSQDLVPLVQLVDSKSPTTLASDVIETLYNLRNVAMHGELDFLGGDDNAAARSGYDLLDSLIRDIRDRW